MITEYFRDKNQFLKGKYVCDFGGSFKTDIRVEGKCDPGSSCFEDFIGDWTLAQWMEPNLCYYIPENIGLSQMYLISKLTHELMENACN